MNEAPSDPSLEYLRPDALALVVRAHVLSVFEASGRNISETARRLEVHRSTAQRMLRRFLGTSEG